MNRPRTGVLLLSDGSRPLEYTLQRSSASGANIKVEPKAAITQHVEFSDGTSQRPATVVWRRSGVVGLRFDDYFRAR